MTATRSRKEEKFYKSYRMNHKKAACDFCNIDKNYSQFLKATRSFKVIRNIFAYSIWDGQEVSDHLMIIPKEHVDSLSKVTSAQAVELLKLISEYEAGGYNFYGRAPSSKIKSVVHQHIHLIKTVGQPKKFVFLLRRPYIRFVL